MERSIRHTFILPQPAEVIWACLTTMELLEQWLMPNDFKLIPGHQFQFQAKPRPNFGFDGKIYCEILEIVPYKRLSYSWRGGKGPQVTLDSVVTWTLKSNGTETELELVHSGYQGIRNMIAYLLMNKGWLKIGERLASRLSSPGHAKI